MPKTITTIRLDESDRRRIADLREEYGFDSDASAIRAALLYVATNGFTRAEKKSRKKVSDGA